MTGRKPPSSLDDLGKRLDEARARQPGGDRQGPGGRAGSMSGLGMAMRIAVEMVVALVVSVAIGWLLDEWLDTRPWLMLVFFVLGVSAGGLNVYRVASRLGSAIGYHEQPAKTKEPEDGQQDGQ
jgi:ATP synthase protein I